MANSFRNHIVISLWWSRKELYTTFFQFTYCVDDIFCGNSNMLYSFSFVEIKIFFYLRFLLPSAGSLIGNFAYPFPLDITLDIKAEYSVLICLSSKERILTNPITFSYHSTVGIILFQSTFPTQWSTYSKPTSSGL